MNSANNNTWKNFSIFISSTFSDMDGERDYIKDVVIPRLNKVLSEYSVVVNVCDLRSGINTLEVPENEQNLYILNSCFKAIQECTPFFIGMIGDRYGWVPSYEEVRQLEHIFMTYGINLDDIEKKSVTEIEMLLGGILGVDQQAIFCIRESVAEYSDPNVERLKHLIIDRYGEVGKEHLIINYKADSAESGALIEMYQYFGDRLYDTLLNLILNYVEVESKEVNKIGRNINKFLFQKTINYIEPTFSHMYKRSIDDHNSVVIGGYEGYGKSAYLAKLYKELQLKNENEIVLFYSFDIVDNPKRLFEMIKYWLVQSGEDMIIPDNIPYEYLFILLFEKFVERLSNKGYELTIIIDSFDKMESFYDLNFGDLGWIPDSVKYIISVECCDSIISHVHKFDLLPFSKTDMRFFINSMGYKDLTDTVIDKLLALNYEKEDEVYVLPYNSPLFYKLMVQYIMDLGKHDYKKIREAPVYYEEMQKYRMNLIPDEEIDLIEAFQYNLLKNKDLVSPVAYSVLIFLAYSKSGLREVDLAAIMGENWDRHSINILANKFPDYINYSSESKKWYILYESCKIAIFDAQYSIIDTIYTGYKEICNYLLTLDFDDEIVVNELFYYIIHANIVKLPKKVIKEISCNFDFRMNAINTIYKGITDDYTKNKYLSWLENVVENGEHSLKIVDFCMDIAETIDSYNNSVVIIDTYKNIFNFLIDNSFEKMGNEANVLLVKLSNHLVHMYIKSDLLETADSFVQKSQELNESLKLRDQKAYLYFKNKIDFYIKTIASKKLGIKEDENNDYTHFSYNENSIRNNRERIIELEDLLLQFPSDVDTKQSLAMSYSELSKILYYSDIDKSDKVLEKCNVKLVELMKECKDISVLHTTAHIMFHQGVFYRDNKDYDRAVVCFQKVNPIDKFLYEKNETYENAANLKSLNKLIADCFCSLNLKDEMHNSIMCAKQYENHCNDLKVLITDRSEYAEMYKRLDLLELAYYEYDTICETLYDLIQEGKGNKYFYTFNDCLIESGILLCKLDCKENGFKAFMTARSNSLSLIEQTLDTDMEFAADFQSLLQKVNDAINKFSK